MSEDHAELPELIDPFYSGWYRLEGTTPVRLRPGEVPDTKFWEDPRRHVGDSTFKVWELRKPRVGGYSKPPKRISVRVSTVFLGLDHGFDPKKPPVLFETMVFFETKTGWRSPLESECDRYSSWEEAEAGHREMCERVIKLHRKT